MSYALSHIPDCFYFIFWTKAYSREPKNTYDPLYDLICWALHKDAMWAFYDIKRLFYDAFRENQQPPVVFLYIIQQKQRCFSIY